MTDPVLLARRRELVIELRRVATRIRKIEHWSADAYANRDALIREASDLGLTQAHIGALLGISEGRVSQLINGEERAQ